MAVLVFVLASLALAVPSPTAALVETFGPGWRDRWEERPLDRRPSRYAVVSEGGDPVLLAESERGASALWRSVGRDASLAPRISWRWRVREAIAAATSERVRSGDDYTARVLVAFGDESAGEGRGLCYVWARREAVGSVYDNPYLPRVKTIVLQSGDGRSGLWVSESRDLGEDYRAAFGEDPQPVTAVAIVVDTDDTGASAQAWFDDVVLEAAREPASAVLPSPPQQPLPPR